MSAPPPGNRVMHLHIQKVVKSLTLLSSSLPDNIPVATRHDKIYTAIPTAPIESQGSAIFETFNHVTDILFKEYADCRDEHGRFHYIRRGKLGMENFCVYIGKINWEVSDIPLDLVGMKLERILDELKYLTCVTNIYIYIQSNIKLPPKKTGVYNNAKTKPVPKTKKKAKKMSGITQDLINGAVRDLWSLPSKGNVTLNSRLALNKRSKYLVLDGECTDINSEDDATFKPRQNMERELSKDSILLYTLDKDGLEVDDSKNDPKKRQRVVSDTESEGEQVNKGPLYKKAKKSASAAKSAKIKVIDVDDVPEASETEVKYNKKGPANHSRAHFRNPVPVVVQGVHQWEFSHKTVYL
ncbi:hypothetical protein JR316_0009720 [Psilocybe cubensis]|uniref:Uncharacterized protein n=1 Tax=Psilocybe cubensis TaxID=181762 RepID=A0ACB8GQ09_PSICU|nr:hypothetical protein JR316_0009720 [Psilocybe cubensis]KAH9477502.1 hypothetical protein JR316_0009720 [Psilocybe cubensis]